MEKNIGKVDRIIRAIFVAVFIYLGYSYHWAWYIPAVIDAYTVATSTCIPYTWFGINTN